MIKFTTLLISCVVFVSSTLCADSVSRAEAALQYYREGEVATNLDQRENAFNEALAIYGELAEEFPSGRVNFNLGNCYFQLGEYGWASLYYHRALKSLPRDEKVKQNLALAQGKLGLEGSSISSAFESILFFHYRLSSEERWGWFSLFAVMASLGFALFVWSKRRLYYLSATGFSLAAFAMLASLAASQFFGSIYGIMVHPAPLYRDAGTRYALVRQLPLPTGVRVKVLDVTQEGTWLQVTGDGVVGFVEADHVRLI
ncbi:Uncharacterized protein SCG7086_BO_00040 [Chlamydiales bacterium SCGC AG-110-P3]|nr:Uncharacterized protein SCG7086_BO_00040 [Chlamydiales bacterium SCGC AG-110-P3]